MPYCHVCLVVTVKISVLVNEACETIGEKYYRSGNTSLTYLKLNWVETFKLYAQLVIMDWVGVVTEERNLLNFVNHTNL